mmetsp:Transcript_10477/g.25346  ORF Transcript_10477/g.25346 Transcript_10477/m.25346 type:complete len:98 (-) Transcript_10477:552-845(-)
MPSIGKAVLLKSRINMTIACNSAIATVRKNKVGPKIVGRMMSRGFSPGERLWRKAASSNKHHMRRENVESHSTIIAFVRLIKAAMLLIPMSLRDLSS